MGEHALDSSWPSVESAAVSDELDLDAWVDGTCGLTRTAQIFRDGATLAKIEALRQDLEVLKKVPKDQRGVSDQSPEQIEREIDDLSATVMESALTVHIQDRTDERRRKIRDRLIKDMGADKNKLTEDQQETIGLHTLADAIVQVDSGGKSKKLPDGFPPNKLRELRDKLGDSGLFGCWNAYYKVTSEAPSVSAPLSRPNSSGAGGIT